MFYVYTILNFQCDTHTSCHCNVLRVDKHEIPRVSNTTMFIIFFMRLITFGNSLRARFRILCQNEILKKDTFIILYKMAENILNLEEKEKMVRHTVLASMPNHA